MLSSYLQSFLKRYQHGYEISILHCSSTCISPDHWSQNYGASINRRRLVSVSSFPCIVQTKMSENSKHCFFLFFFSLFWRRVFSLRKMLAGLKKSWGSLEQPKTVWWSSQAHWGSLPSFPSLFTRQGAKFPEKISWYFTFLNINVLFLLISCRFYSVCEEIKGLFTWSKTGIARIFLGRTSMQWYRIVCTMWILSR